MRRLLTGVRVIRSEELASLYQGSSCTTSTTTSWKSRRTSITDNTDDEGAESGSSLHEVVGQLAGDTAGSCVEADVEVCSPVDPSISRSSGDDWAHEEEDGIMCRRRRHVVSFLPDLLSDRFHVPMWLSFRCSLLRHPAPERSNTGLTGRTNGSLCSGMGTRLQENARPVIRAAVLLV